MKLTLNLVVGLMIASSSFAESTTPHAAAPAGSVAPTVAPSIAAKQAPTAATPSAPLTDAEKKKLISEFQKALVNQKGALAHQEAHSMNELSVVQKMKQRKWRHEQKQARHDFFDQHMSGPERREYVQSYLKKKEEFDAAIKAEFLAAKKSWMEKSVALKTTHKELEAKFNDFLSKGVRPPVTLWPTGN